MQAFDARDGRSPVVGIAENEQHENDGVPQWRDQLAFGIWLEIGCGGGGGHFCVGQRLRSSEYPTGDARDARIVDRETRKLRKAQSSGSRFLWRRGVRRLATRA